MKVDRSLLEAYSEAKAVLMAITPFVASLLNKARVVITKAVPTAAVDSKNNIIVNPDFFIALRPEDRVFVLAHETLHWAFLDAQREQNRNHTAWNIAADAVNNEALLEILRPSRMLVNNMITLYKVAEMTGTNVSELKNMTKEQIYELLVRNMQGDNGDKNNNEEQEGQENDGNGGGNGGKSPLDNAAIGSDLRRDEVKDGEVIQEGSKDIYDASNPDGARDAMKRAVAEAEAMQKARGTMPAGLRRIVDGMLRPKVPWKVLLRQALRSGLGRTSVATWQRPNRKRKDAIGRRRITTPTVWVGVDTSGSIGEKELAQFLAEIHSIAKKTRATVVVVPWDAEVYEPIKITSASQIDRVAGNLRGGGGTNPEPFLKLVQKKMKPLDAVVILSDGYIGSQEYYENEAAAIKTKASVAIFVSTGREVTWKGWKSIKMEL